MENTFHVMMIDKNLQFPKFFYSFAQLVDPGSTSGRGGGRIPKKCLEKMPKKYLETVKFPKHF